MTTDSNLDELWKDVVGYEGYYEVSSIGRVRSVERKTKSRFGLKTSPSRVLKGYVTNVGYLRVDLSRDGNKKHVSVHRLIAEAFIPNPKSLKCVNHIDSDRLNNKATNLEWSTHKENTAHALSKGRMKWRSGDNHPARQATECKKGHPYTKESTRWRNGIRHCLICKRADNKINNAKYRLRQKAKEVFKQN